MGGGGAGATGRGGASGAPAGAGAQVRRGGCERSIPGGAGARGGSGAAGTSGCRRHGRERNIRHRGRFRRFGISGASGRGIGGDHGVARRRFGTIGRDARLRLRRERGSRRARRRAARARVLGARAPVPSPARAHRVAEAAPPRVRGSFGPGPRVCVLSVPWRKMAVARALSRRGSRASSARAATNWGSPPPANVSVLRAPGAEDCPDADRPAGPGSERSGHTLATLAATEPPFAGEVSFTREGARYRAALRTSGLKRGERLLEDEGPPARRWRKRSG